MHETIRRIWNMGLTTAEYCKPYGFSERYLSEIVAGRRGVWKAGEAARIIKQLKEDGLWVEPSE